MSSLKVRGIAKRFGATLALADIDLDVAALGRTAIVGPSGSGKTTLLRLIAGFEPPDTGTITLGDTVFADGPAIMPTHLRDIGIVAQEGALFPHLSVADNIGFGLRTEPDRQARIANLMDMVELPQSMAQRRPHQLSGGQQQRVALARSLARRPRLMLLDEPFSALDTGLRHAMRKMTAEVLREASIPALMVTHDQSEALSFADQMALLHEGRLVQVGPPQELYMRPVNSWAAQFLGEAIFLPAIAHDGHANCLLGRVPVAAGTSGPVRIMLRPEQVRLHADPLEDSACLGVVTSLEFEGALCSVAVDLPATEVSGPGDERTLRLRTTSVDAPAAGASVRVSVVGAAQIL